MVLATPMIVSTSMQMNRSLVNTSLCSGARRVSSARSGGGRGQPFPPPGTWFSLSRHSEDRLDLLARLEGSEGEKLSTTVFLVLGTSGISVAAALTLRPPLLLSSPPHWLGDPRPPPPPPHWLGDPRIGGRVGGVKRPEDLEDRRGEERGDTAGGETVQAAVAAAGGGELPQAEPLLPLLVRRRCGTGGVPIENCICGGDMETMSG